MRSSKLAALAVLGFALALGCSAPSAEEEEGDDAEDGNAAVTTPRDKANDTSARITELQRALQTAKVEDFGNAIHASVKLSIDGLIWVYRRADLDTGVRAYSFITGGKKAYVIETHPIRKGGVEGRNLYLYEAVGYPNAESKPTKIGLCEAPSLKPEAVLSCKQASQVNNMFDA